MKTIRYSKFNDHNQESRYHMFMVDPYFYIETIEEKNKDHKYDRSIYKSQRSIDIAVKYLMNRTSLAEVGKEFGISNQTVRQHVDKFLRRVQWIYARRLNK